MHFAKLGYPSEMHIAFAEAEHIFTVRKTLVHPLHWNSASKSGRKRACLECRVEIDGGAIPRGVVFRIIAYPTHLNSFTFQLECERVEARAHIALYRLEVSPFRQHTNKFYGPDKIRGRNFSPGETHEHDFHDSLTESGEVWTVSCEQARNISDPPKNFATALERVCSRICIVNGTDVPHPPSQGSLF